MELMIKTHDLAKKYEAAAPVFFVFGVRRFRYDL